MSERRGVLARLSSFVRWLLLALLVCAAGLVTCRQLLIAQLDEQIRLRVEAMFAEHYTDMEVRIQAARRLEGKGIELRGFSLMSHSDATRYRDLLYIDEMFLECEASLPELLSGQPNVRRLTVRRMRIHATCGRERIWNAGRLLPLPSFGGTLPVVVVEDSSVELQDLCRPGGGAWTLRNINLSAQTPPGGRQTGSQWQFEGSLLGDHFKHVKLQGKADTHKGSWLAWGTIDGLEMSRQMTAALPDDVAKYLSVWVTLRARAQLEFQVGHEPGDAVPLRYRVQGHLSDGRVDDPRLPLPFTDLEADVRIDNQQVSIQQVTARSGPTRLELACECHDYLGASPQLKLTAQLRELPLDERLREALPPPLQDDWAKFAPAGAVDAEIELQLVDGKLVPDVTVTCRDVSFAYHRFPLRLQQGKGVIRLVGHRVVVREFAAVAGGQVISFSAEFQNLGPQATGWLDLRSSGPIPLDHKLIEAMNPVGQKIVRSLQPTGGITLTSGRVEKASPDAPAQTRWEIGLVDCSLQYERFPYAIHRISGQLILADRQWIFQDLQGTHAGSRIRCDGGWIPSTGGQPGGELELNLQCWDVPLDESLRNALGKLKEEAGRFWDTMRPRGTVDRVDVSVRFDLLTRQMRLDVTADKGRPKQNGDGRSITIHPTWFPVRLDDCTGHVHFADGQFQLDNVIASRGGSRVELAGHGQVLPGRPWDVTLTRVIADALPLDQDLIEAMPEPMRPGVRQLKYRGELSVNGNAFLQGGAGQPLAARWDLLLDIDDGALENQLKLEHVFGGVRLTGERNAQGFYSRGILEVDSLHTHGLQVTQVQGPFWFDGRQLFVGLRERDRPPQQVTAHALGGELTVEAHILLTDQLPFAVNASLAHGDVSEISRSIHTQRLDISGRVYVVLQLAGNVLGAHTLQGSGHVSLREADIYQLPVMVQLLKVLRNRPPDATAFTSGDADFRVKNEQLQLDRIDFSGDAISLKGQGWIDFKRQVSLDFYALLGREEIQLPLIRKVLAEASRNILSIEVRGDIDNPQVNKKPLPELDETLQRLFPEATARTAAPELPWSSGR